MQETLSLAEREIQFNRFVVAEYLKYGSVDEVFRKNEYNLPISYPGVHRLIDKWGIVKAAGPNSKLSEAICFLTCLSQEKIPLERLYKKMPENFQTSLATLHRIMHNIKEGVARRVGTALVITPQDNQGLILVGDDVSTPRMELGKPFGAVSLPMGFSKKAEDPTTSITRVLQQEVFMKHAVDKKTPYGIIPNNIKPFLYIDIMDVRVSVYHLALPNEFMAENPFSSFKLVKHRFSDVEELEKGDGKKIRAGIAEIAMGFKYYLDTQDAPSWEKALLNKKLLALNLDYSL